MGGKNQYMKIYLIKYIKENYTIGKHLDQINYHHWNLLMPTD
jgi:hypothetical protein